MQPADGAPVVRFFPATAPPAKKPRLPARLQLVLPGEFIQTEPGFMRGHGTYVKDERLVASVAGLVEKVNKLVSVRPLHARYQGEVGDVIVGRVTELAPKRWRLDVGGRQDAILMLSAINLPGGVQRRRTTDDELSMRSFFVEDDLVSAEVQQFFSDGAMAIHTRSARYGKLENGQFVAVPPALVRRGKSAFAALPCGVEVILAANGYLWVQPAPVPEGAAPPALDRAMREKIARVANVVAALRTVFIAIHAASITDTYDESVRLGVALGAMLSPANIELITRHARERAAEAWAA